MVINGFIETVYVETINYPLLYLFRFCKPHTLLGFHLLFLSSLSSFSLYKSHLCLYIQNAVIYTSRPDDFRSPGNSVAAELNISSIRTRRFIPFRWLCLTRRVESFGSLSLTRSLELLWECGKRNWDFCCCWSSGSWPRVVLAFSRALIVCVWFRVQWRLVGEEQWLKSKFLGMRWWVSVLVCYILWSRCRQCYASSVFIYYFYFLSFRVKFCRSFGSRTLFYLWFSSINLRK